MTKHVATYTRISKDHDGSGVSVENQMKAIKEYVEKQGWTISESFSDNDISATSGKRRPGFEALLKSGHPEVVVWTQDRLLRVSKDLELVLDAGLIVHQVVAGTLDLKTTQGRAIARTLAAWATHEVELKSDRQKLRNKGAVESGLYIGKHQTFGQGRDGALIEPEATAVREAAKDLASREATFYSIAQRWNAEGFTTPINGKRGGKPWHANNVRVFFTSPRLKGYQAYEGTLYPLKDWESLLDEDTWDQIQSLIESKKTGTEGAYTGKDSRQLLSGILTCGLCGRGMTTSNRSWGKGDDKRVYRCVTSGHNSVKLLDVDEAIRHDALSLLVRRDEHEGEVQELKDEISKLTHSIRTKETEFQVWMDEALAARLKPSSIAKAETLHQTEIEALQGQVATLQAQTAVDLFSNSGAGWDTAPMVKRRDLIQTIYKSITVKPGQQGKKFSEDRLELEYTEFALELIKRYIQDEDVKKWNY